MTEVGRRRPDTDWHLSRLYDFPELANASWLAARYSRYVVDLNRPPDDGRLYPGQVSTGLCPSISFGGERLYREGEEPGEEEVAERVARYWRPYHAQLEGELERLTERFGFAVLLDAHSIAGQIPRLFEGRLPDFNFGTNRGASCPAGMQARIEAFSQALRGYGSVVNGRFVGGYITRHYGSRESVHAVQLELVQATYMDESTFEYDPERAAEVQPTLRDFVQMLQGWMEETKR